MESRVADEKLKASLVRVSNADKAVVGAGFLVSERHVLTCAHVVAQALGTRDDTLEAPQGIVRLDFPFRNAAVRTARVENWQPRRNPETNPSGDIAILRLDTAAPSTAKPARLTVESRLSEHKLSAYGFPRRHDAGVWAYSIPHDLLGNGWLQIGEDPERPGKSIERGFSGGPVRDRKTGSIVGMAVASTGEKVGFVIPTEVLANVFPRLEIDELDDFTEKSPSTHLKAARQRLVEMPLDEVPARAPLPAGSHMPRSSNPLFVGREEELKALATSLKASDTAAMGQVMMAAVTGLGGIGKTLLASEFVHRYGQYFLGGVFWLSFANPNAIPAEVAACGGAGAMRLRTDFRTLHLEDQVSEVMSAWQSELPRLLVFDNCEDEELLARWQPPTGGCRVLVSSRREIWNPQLGVSVVALDVLSREESVALLCKYRPALSKDDPVLGAIADELGDLPLALELAGSFLAKYHQVVLPYDYLEQLRSPELLGHRSLGEPKNVARTFMLSYQRLDATDLTDELATKMLARAARLAPGEPIPHNLLLTTLNLPDEDLDAPLLAQDALGRLAELGMLQEQEEGTLRMHRLVAAFVRDEVSDVEAQGSVEATLEHAVADLIEEGYPAALPALLPHLRTVTDDAKEREDEQAGLLCDRLGLCLGMIGAYTEARPYLGHAVAIREKLLGEEHPDTATSLNNLALVVEAQGDLEEARRLLERAIAIREKLLGEEHPDTATSLNNLGKVLGKQRLYKEARARHERALAVYEKVYGEEHPDTALGLRYLANVLYNQGSYEEARPLYERALAVYEKVYGEEHPDTASTLNNLANLLGDRDSFDKARSLYERALKIREKVLGKEHPDTASTLNNLANLLRDRWLYDEARPLYQRSLAVYEKVFGEKHPTTQQVRQSLTNVRTK